MLITINRLRMDTTGTLSEVSVDNNRFMGIEKPWRDNAPFVSCIPAGIYTLVPYSSNKYPDVYAFEGGSVSIKETPPAKRYKCLIHVANWGRQVQGCLGLGLAELKGGELGVSRSRDAISELRQILGEYEHKVVISWFQ